MLLSDEVTCQFVLSSVVSKLLLFANECFMLIVGSTNKCLYFIQQQKYISQQEYILLLNKARFKCIVIYHCTRISRK